LGSDRCGHAKSESANSLLDREPQAWKTSAPASFLTIERERGTVEVWAHGSERFTVRAPEREQLVVGFTESREAAHALAEQVV
jgi:hypothetical protein